MGENSFNGVLYYVFAVIVIMWLIVFSLARIFPQIKLRYGSAVKKLNILKDKNDIALKLQMYFRRYIKSPVKRATESITQRLGITSGHLQQAELFIQKAVPAVTTEPVNLLALVIRKCYTDNPAPLITLSASIIVVFYFILTIF